MTNSEMRRAIAARLRSARQDREMTQPELALALGISTQLISALENGKAQMYAHQVAACAQILGVEPNWLLLGETGRADAPWHLAASVPLLSMEEVSALAAGHLPLASSHRHVVFGSEPPDTCFAFVVADNSMAPVLEQGDIALVEPETLAGQGDLVLAALMERNEPNGAVETVVVRRVSFLMQMAAPPLILAPVSPDWAIRRISSSSEGRILGVVVTLIRAMNASGLMEVVESNRSTCRHPAP